MLPPEFAKWPNVETTKFSEPGYASFLRATAGQLVLQELSTLGTCALSADWALANKLLFLEEIEQIAAEKLYFPTPWTPEKTRLITPDKFDDIVGLFMISVPELARRGVRIGLTGVVCDVLHTGHLHYFRECKKHCDLLVVGVDDNDLVEETKGSSRPFNDFPVRVGTLSELPEIDVLFRVEASLRNYPQNIRPLTHFLLKQFDNYPHDTGEVLRAKEHAERINPDWYANIGPQLVFFATEGDPVLELKAMQANHLGSKLMVFPKHSSVNTTKIAQQFGLVKPTTHTNRFVNQTRYLRAYDELGRF